MCLSHRVVMRHKWVNYKQTVSSKCYVSVSDCYNCPYLLFKLKFYPCYQVYPNSVPIEAFQFFEIWWHFKNSLWMLSIQYVVVWVLFSEWAWRQTAGARIPAPPPVALAKWLLKPQFPQLYTADNNITCLHGFLCKPGGKIYLKPNRVAGTQELTKCLMLINCKSRVRRVCLNPQIPSTWSSTGW